MVGPDLRLTFDGVEYAVLVTPGAASPNMDDMEVVGTGIQHNPDGDATVQLYRPKANGTTDVYTFHPPADEA